MENQEHATQENIFPEDQSSPAVTRKKSVAVVITVLLVAAIVLCILVIGQVLSKGYVSVGGYSLFRVVTGSMEPEIPVGALLIARQTPIEQIGEGDIVTYRSREQGMSGVEITHRVISLYEGADGTRYLETKGDANQYADASYVDETHLIGKVVFHTRQNNVIAKLLTFITSEVGFLACIVLPCILIGMFVMRDCVRSLKMEVDAINQEIEAIKHAEEDPLEKQMGQEAYQELCERLRDELLKELKQGAEPETTEQKPGAQQQQYAPPDG